MRFTNSPLLLPIYFVLVSACFLLGSQSTAFAQVVVDLQILNPSNSNGEIVISKAIT